MVVGAEMSRILLVTQATRSYGEFRRPWVRSLYRRYVDAYRTRVAAAAEALAREGDLAVLGARELVDEARLPAGTITRYFDAESYQVDSDRLSRITTELAAGAWSAAEPALRYRGVWLPDVLEIARGIVFRMEIAEPFGMVERALDEIRPERIVLLSGRSVPERLARVLARRAAIAVSTWADDFVAARLVTVTGRALAYREERLRIGMLLTFPRSRPAPAPLPPPPPGRERVLLVTCRPRHHFVVDPLVEALTAAGAEAHVLAAPNPEPGFDARLIELRKAGVAAGYLTDHLPRVEARRLAARHRAAFQDVWARYERAPRVARESAAGDLGVDLLGVARPLLRDSVELSLVSAVLFQEAAFRALDAIRPTAVIVTSNRRHAERAIAFAARARGIPRLLFSGTLLVGRDRYRMFGDVADRMLVIGDDLRDKLVEAKDVDPRRISVVGDPRSNAARLVPPARLREEVCGRFALDPGRPVVVFLSKYASFLFSVEEKAAYYRTAIEAAAKLPGAQFIVKAHPNEDLPLLERQVRKWGWADATLTKDYDIHRLFGAADAAVMVTSMGGIEAMALGCPVVAVQQEGKDYEGAYMPPYVTERAVEHVVMGDPAGLAAALGRLFDDPEHRAGLIERGARFAARYVRPVDGALGRRVLDAVTQARQDMTGDAR
jgi:glycosyltransferase involved in cell wall biosynthesis